MEGEYELLRMEVNEIHSFARHHFQLYLTWFTFFLTVNFAAIGWFTSVMLTGALKVSLPIIFIAAFFIGQLAISYLACLEVRDYFKRTYERCNELLAVLVKEPSALPVRPTSPIPLQSYLKIIRLMCLTLVSFALFWSALTAVSVYLVPL